MDKIYLKNVEIFANHGVFKEEKTLGQKFILDLELTLSLEEAGRTGDLKKIRKWQRLLQSTMFNVS